MSDIASRAPARLSSAGAESALRAARAAIADSFVASERHATLGQITLRASQREALARVTRLLETSGGCLLADDVGRGKTYVALAAARRWSQPLIVVPAGLTDQWRRAMQRTGVCHRVVTHESLSRHADALLAADGIIVDESHHYRNLGTRRHARLAEISAHAELLLLSATPVQNRIGDLSSQLALFLGSVAFALDDESRAHYVVRVDDDGAAAGLPTVRPPQWVSVNADDTRVLDAIVALPAPPHALDAGDAGALRTLSLVRAWASSHAALRAAVSRRLGTAHAIADSLTACRVPTRAELCSWRGGDEAVQLGFASLLAAHDITEDVAARQALQAEVDAELLALADLRRRLDRATNVDEARAAALVAIIDAHPHARVLAFTQLATTAREYYALLRRRPGVALLTAGGGVIASGRIARRDILVRFAPESQGAPEPPPRERIDVLISTDLLSEGVNLQDASVVVHLDLPWNPARLAQRLGRVRRPGGASEVTSLLLAPPASTEHLVGIEGRLRRKLEDAARSVGAVIDAVPALTVSGVAWPASASLEHGVRRARLEARLRRWRGEAPDAPRGSPRATTAAVLAPIAGWLALLDDQRLVAFRESRAGSGIELLDWATHLAEGAATDVDPLQAARAHGAFDAWRERERLLADCGVGRVVPDVARVVQQRVATALGTAPRHLRARCLQIARQIQRACAGPLPLGVERAMHKVAARGADAGILPWLTELSDCLPQRTHQPLAPSAGARIRVLVVFQPGTGWSTTDAPDARYHEQHTG